MTGSTGLCEERGSQMSGETDGAEGRRVSLRMIGSWLEDEGRYSWEEGGAAGTGGRGEKLHMEPRSKTRACS